MRKRIQLDPNDVVTNWLYAQYYYNKGIDTRDSALKIKGTKPDDVKKKADLNAEAKDNFNKAIPYGDKGAEYIGSGGIKNLINPVINQL